MKEDINDKLVKDFPEKFAGCVPRTSSHIHLAMYMYMYFVHLHVVCTCICTREQLDIHVITNNMNERKYSIMTRDTPALNNNYLLCGQCINSAI